MNGIGELSVVHSVKFTRTLPGSLDKIWAHLTQPHLLPGWFGDDSSIEPRQGGAVRLMGAHIRGTVTQWQPPSPSKQAKLVYTWNVFNPDDGADAISAYPESYPTFELKAEGESVHLTFTHFPVLERFIAQNAMGWHSMLEMLAATLQNRKVEARAVYMQKNAALYGVDLKNLTR